MILHLNTASHIPLYLQLRNEIVMGIGRGDLKIGSPLPTVRQMAQDMGVNPMTVNKSYALLKQEGFIDIDRRNGAMVNPRTDVHGIFYTKMESELELLIAESALKGISKQALLSTAEQLFDRITVSPNPA